MRLTSKFKTYLILGMTFLSLSSLFVGTYSWFVNAIKMSEVDLSGTTQASYFAGGTGVDGDPFIIKNKRHLYNLAWLQDMGVFNVDGDDADTKIDQKYFKLDDSLKSTGLDMDGMVIPPIGTEQYAFLGNFDGNGVTIKNFTISNDFDDYADHPRNVEEFGTEAGEINQPKVVGLFGVIGQKNINYNYDHDENLITSFALDNFVVKTVSSKTLAGLAVGYANAESSNIGVNNGTLDIDENCDALSDANIKNISDYGLVGYATDDFKVEDSDYSYDIYAPVDIDKSKYETDFGGSLPMREIYTRGAATMPNKYQPALYKNSNNQTIGSYGYGNVSSNATLQLTGVNIYKYHKYGYYDYGPYDTYIPFNFTKNGNTYEINDNNTGYLTASNVRIDKTDNYYGSALRISGGASYHRNNQSIGLSIGESGRDAAPVNVTDSTVLYLVTKNRFSNANNNIPSDYDGYTMIDYNGSGQLTSCNPNVSNSSTYSEQRAHYNLYTHRMTIDQLGLDAGAFKASYTNMKNELKTSQYVSGFRYMTYYAGNGNSTPRLDNKITLDFAYVSKKEYTNYELIGNGANFELGLTGTVRFYGFQFSQVSTKGASEDSDRNLKTLYSGDYKAEDFGFGRLYKVDRTVAGSSSVITGLHQITLIYKDKSKPAKDPNEFVYVYKGDTDIYSGSSNYELYFNMAWINGSSKMLSRLPGTLYYYEIPLNKGDYVLGCPEIPNGCSKVAGGYILYLDVAANSAAGGSYWQDKYKETSDTTAYVIGIDFVIIDDYIPAQSPITGGNSASIKIESSVDGDIIFTYSYTGDPGSQESGPPTTLTLSEPTHGSLKYTYTGENVTVTGAQSEASGGGYTLVEQAIQNTQTEITIKEGPFIGEYDKNGTLISGTAETWSAQSTVICSFTGNIPSTVSFERIYTTNTTVIFIFKPLNNKPKCLVLMSLLSLMGIQ